MRHTATIKLQLYTERQTDRQTRLKRDISQKRKKSLIHIYFS